MLRIMPSSVSSRRSIWGWHCCFFFTILLCLAACSSNDKEQIDAITDRSLIPMLDTDTVTTLISDSGITRYRISATKWDIYDKAVPSYWEFQQGIYLEKFNEDFETEASLRSDYARYDDVAQVWELDGNVKAMNLQGEQFETQQLFWDQQSGRVYSDSSITVTRANSIIVGVGFESNQEMTQYTILHPQGVFPIKDN